MYIILGLGNPGKKYVDTPHNVGFEFLDQLANSDRWKIKPSLAYQNTIINGQPFILAKPTTYMNLSGLAAGYLLSYYKLDLKNLIVVVDDVNIPLGSVRIRSGGSAGGHNGLKSIIDHCGKEFPRIRIGIGTCPPEVDLSAFVLKKFRSSDKKVIDNIKPDFLEMIKTGISSGWETAASRYNRTPQI